MLYERTAISKKPELTIVNDLKQLSEKNKMTIDFAFLGRQVRITVGNKDYYIDLLFYHRKLRRLVLIELLEVDKSGIHVGQYLTLLPPKELFQEKLHKAIERAKESFGAKGLEE
ncbi:DUF1016 domain-containing protein [Clostridium gasigenes]|nr:DUF1016 domain-containing protein [Clostridium gasigenes]